MQALILAGGFGKRLRSIVSDVPKPLAPINNHPFIYYQLKYLENYNFQKVYIAVGYKKELIIDFLKKNKFSFDIKLVEENSPLGTGGAIKYFFNIYNKYIDDNFFVLNGDTYFPINLLDFLKFHLDLNSDLTIASRKVDSNDRYSSIQLDKENKIIEFQKPNGLSSMINAGIYIFKKNKVNLIFLQNSNKIFSVEEDVFPVAIHEINCYTKTFDTDFIDIGIPNDYLKASDIIPKY
jgi:D-glycero-alpha-D-manno-heptose 1-phosphate guanylyltransferase